MWCEMCDKKLSHKSKSPNPLLFALPNARKFVSPPALKSVRASELEVHDPRLDSSFRVATRQTSSADPTRTC